MQGPGAKPLDSPCRGRTFDRARVPEARHLTDVFDGGRGMILDEILRAKRGEIARLEGSEVLLAELARRAPRPRGFEAAIVEEDAVSVIAEFKRRSPSAGPINAYANPRSVVAAYERGGAAAVSVLTDGPHFGGSLEDLATAREVCSIPILRKDFIIHPIQLLESRAAGADGVLLIYRALDHGVLAELLENCEELGMAALVEVHDSAELEGALEAGARIVGVNARDLSTFEIDLDAGLEIISRVPGDRVAVAESGVSGRGDVSRAGRAGADAILVGSLLMRQDPSQGVAELIGERRLPRAFEHEARVEEELE